MLQSTDPERLSNKEGSWGMDTQISLEKGNRRDFMSGVRAGGHKNMSNQVRRARRERLLRGYILGSGRSLTQRAHRNLQGGI